MLRDLFKLGRVSSSVPDPRKLRFSPRDIAITILPSFVSYACFDGVESPAGKTFDTSYLDGLRGIASWVVFNFHLTMFLSGDPRRGWGKEDADVDFFWLLPFVRTLIAGELAVAIFFIVSGMALSLAAVKMMTQPHQDGLRFLKSTCSSIFRRPFRLFLPSWAAAGIMYLVYRAGILQLLQPMVEAGSVMQGFPLVAGTPTDSFLSGAWGVFKEDMRMLHIFREIDLSTMGHFWIPPLWTIPVEFRASLMLFLVHCATFHFKTSARMLLVAAAVITCVTMSNIDIVLFLTGFLMAEINLLSPPSKQREFGFCVSLILYALLIFAIFIGSVPEWDAESTPAYYWTAVATPQNYDTARFWAAVGGTLIVQLSSRIPSLCWFLSTPVIRYLGKICFGMYLMHWLMIRMVGLPMFWLTWTIMGRDTVLGAPLGFIISYIVLLFSLIWVSDLFWRLVDMPCVKFAKDLERWLMRPEPAVLG